MDLTKEYPRSVHAKWLGVVQLGRTLDKGKAVAHGNIGEYHYNCSMDQAVFAFLGLNADDVLEVIKKSGSDGEIESYIRPFVARKTAEEIARWNREYVARRPEGESLEFFLKLRNSIAPERTDVTAWPDLLDLDEKREVPRRDPVTTAV